MRKNLESKFNKPNIVKNAGGKYSELMDRFISVFAEDLIHFEDPNDVMEFALNAWNLANIKADLPKAESEKVLDAFKDDDAESILIKKMIDYKIEHFSKYTEFIVDFELEETAADPILKVITQDKEAYLAQLVAELHEDIDEEAEHEEGFINRNAIILTSLQPFRDWLKSVYPEDNPALNESSVYLVDDEIDNLDAYLKMEFDKFFQMELEAWETGGEVWPKKRTYKMFKEWFQVGTSKMVFDMEEFPVNKG